MEKTVVPSSQGYSEDSVKGMSPIWHSACRGIHTADIPALVVAVEMDDLVSEVVSPWLPEPLPSKPPCISGGVPL